MSESGLGKDEGTAHANASGDQGPRSFFEGFIGKLTIVLGVLCGTAVIVTIGFWESSKPLPVAAMHGVMFTHMTSSGDPVKGKQWFSMSCIACHGDHGQGIPKLGASLRDSKFVASHTDDELVAFIKKGRLPGDPNSVIQGIMPPNGANPMLDDKGLHDVVAFIRTFQQAGNNSSASAPNPAGIAGTN